jgi:hypothetical protein
MASSRRPRGVQSGQNMGPSLTGVFNDSLRRGRLLAFTVQVVVLSAARTLAQDNYEIQVYGYDLVDRGHTMVELHSNFTMDGSKEIVDGTYPTNHAEHETVEVTHGFNDWFECGFYIFTSITEGQGWQWVAITSGRASPSQINGTGQSGSASRTKLAIKGGSTPQIPGRGKFAPSSTKRSGDGIGPSTPRSTAPSTAKMCTRASSFRPMPNSALT